MTLDSELHGSTSIFFRHFLDVDSSNDFDDNLLEECEVFGNKCEEEEGLQVVPTSIEPKQKVYPFTQPETRQLNNNMIEQGGFGDSILQGTPFTQQELPGHNEVKQQVKAHKNYEDDRLNNLNITEQEKQWQCEVEAERRRDRLARETVEQRRRRLDRDRLRNWKRRQFESAEQKQDRRARDRIRHRLKRCTKNKIANERDRLKKQMKRQHETFEEKQERRARDRLRHQLKRWTQNRIMYSKKSSVVDSSSLRIYGASE